MATQFTSKAPVVVERTHPVPLHQYHEAVQRHFGWAATDYQLLEDWPNGPSLVKQGSVVYRVDHLHDVEGQVVLMLTSRAQAQHIPAALANELFQGTYLRPQFYHYLLQQLESVNADAREEVQLVLAIYHTLAPTSVTFWEMLRELDEAKLYPEALLAAVQVLDFEELVGKLSALLTTEGSMLLSELQTGAFRCVSLVEDVEAAPHTFYIYPVNPSTWEARVVANATN